MTLDYLLQLRQQQALTMTPQLQQSMRILQMSADALETFVAEQVVTNPFLSRPEGAFDGAYRPNRIASEELQTWIEQTVPTPSTLADHLMEQLRVVPLSPLQGHITNYLVYSLTPEGYLDRSIEDIAAELDCPFSEVLGVLRQIQRCDPAGVGARSLPECLRLQADAMGLLTPDLDAVLSHIIFLVDEGVSGVARLSGVTPQVCARQLAIIRTLNPKPGLAFEALSPTVERIPEIEVVRAPSGEWSAQVNEAAIPQVLLDSDYYHTVYKMTTSPLDKEYVHQQKCQAIWLLRMLDQRLKTMVAVAQAIISAQQAFFDYGPAALKPLTLKDIATQIGMHESTVSRSAAGKFMQTPWGVIAFKMFFTQSASKTGEQSAPEVQDLIKKLIQKEDKAAPLTDDQIVKQLKTVHIQISRRTVAKYRDILKIPSSYERKKKLKVVVFTH